MTPEERDYILRAMAAIRADEPKRSVLDYLEGSLRVEDD